MVPCWIPVGRLGGTIILMYQTHTRDLRRSLSLAPLMPLHVSCYPSLYYRVPSACAVVGVLSFFWGGGGWSLCLPECLVSSLPNGSISQSHGAWKRSSREGLNHLGCHGGEGKDGKEKFSADENKDPAPTVEDCSFRSWHQQ